MCTNILVRVIKLSVQARIEDFVEDAFNVLDTGGFLALSDKELYIFEFVILELSAVLLVVANHFLEASEVPGRRIFLG